MGPVEDLKEVQLEEADPTKVVKVGKHLETTIKKELVEFLRRNQEVFAWLQKDMVGIDPTVISHVLNIDKNHPQCNKREGCSTRTDRKP